MLLAAQLGEAASARTHACALRRCTVQERPRKAKAAALCLRAAADVPLRVMSHLPMLQLAAERANMATLQAFWRARGCALPQLVVHGCTLDVHEALRQVVLRGGFWACSAAQVLPCLARSHVCEC